MVVALLIHGTGHRNGLTPVVSHVQITHEASIEDRAVSKPPAYVIYSVVQVFLFSSGHVVVEDVKLHRRRFADRVNPSDGQRPDRFLPGIACAEQIKSRTGYLIGALGWMDQRYLPLTPSQIFIPDRYLYFLCLNLIDSEAVAHILSQFQ